MAEYISFARAAVQPWITDEARALIVAGYVGMRTGGAGAGGPRVAGGRKTIFATTRQLESIIRLSEAHARMRLSRTVDPVDVAEALRLIRVATQTAAIDPRTGQIDMARLTTGHAADESNIVSHIAGLLREKALAGALGGKSAVLSVGHIHKELATLAQSLESSASAGGAGGGYGGGDDDEYGGYGGGGSGSTGAGAGAGAGSLASILGLATGEEVMEALRLLSGEPDAVLKLGSGGRVTILKDRQH